MKRIFKYPLSWEQSTDRATVAMPSAASLIHYGNDPLGVPCIWAEVDELDGVETRVVRVVATGQPVPSGFTHVQSFKDGTFIWHIYLQDAR